MPIAAPGNNLTAIMQKVRRLTRSPSINQLSDTDLENYINTFILYDFPEHLRTFNLRTQFSFFCNPFQDVYNTDIASYNGATNAPNNPLYDFQNNYLTVHEPLYIAGYQQFYSQSPSQFFGIYPQTNSVASIGAVGDGSTPSFSGVIQLPLGQPVLLNAGLVNQQVSALLKNNVTFASVDVNGNGCQLADVPALDKVTGLPTQWGALYDPNNSPKPSPVMLTSPYTNITQASTGSNLLPATNYVNYLTGAFSITFTTAPGATQTISSETIPMVVGQPQAMMYYANQFTLRPVPDKPYRVNFEVYARPSYFMSTGQIPQLQEYWQFIAYGAAKKIFEDRFDMESVAAILPEYNEQMLLVNRRNIVQYTNERAATIYTEQTSFGSGFGGWGLGGGPF